MGGVTEIVLGHVVLSPFDTATGGDGVELLTTCMNSYFTKVISCIVAHEGDVVKFAGGFTVLVL